MCLHMDRVFDAQNILLFNTTYHMLQSESVCSFYFCLDMKNKFRREKFDEEFKKNTRRVNQKKNKFVSL